MYMSMAFIIILLWSFNCIVLASARPKSSKEVAFDRHFNRSKIKNDDISYANRRRTQLYSRNSGRHVQILDKGKVVAKGLFGDKYADVVILTVSYGKVRIMGLETDRYICFDKRGRLISRIRPSSKCNFQERFGKDAFTMYIAENPKGKFLAFSKSGTPRFSEKNRSGKKAVQFVERPRSRRVKTNRYYRGKERNNEAWMRTFQIYKTLAQRNESFRPSFVSKKGKRRRKNKASFVNPFVKKFKRRRGKNKNKDKPRFWLDRKSASRKQFGGRKRSRQQNKGRNRKRNKNSLKHSFFKLRRGG